MCAFIKLNCTATARVLAKAAGVRGDSDDILADVANARRRGSLVCAAPWGGGDEHAPTGVLPCLLRMITRGVEVVGEGRRPTQCPAHDAVVNLLKLAFVIARDQRASPAFIAGGWHRHCADYVRDAARSMSAATVTSEASTRLYHHVVLLGALVTQASAGGKVTRTSESKRALLDAGVGLSTG